MVARHPIQSVDPYRPDNVEGWRVPLSTTLLTSSIFEECHIHSTRQGSFQMSQHIISCLRCLWCWWLLSSFARRLFLPENLSLRGSCFDWVWIWQRGFSWGASFRATPLSWMTFDHSNFSICIVLQECSQVSFVLIVSDRVRWDMINPSYFASINFS